MTFYPHLFENLPEKIAKNSVNSEIKKELLARFPEKYGESKSVGSVKTKQRGEITPEDLANDIIQIVKEDKPDWTISKPVIKLTQKPQGLSGKYPTIFFTINGREEKFALRGEQSTQATGTPTNVKECLVCFFFSSDKKYEPFKKIGKQQEKIQNYIVFLDEITTDIKENGIEGCHQKDIDEVLNFLEFEVENYNLDVLNSIFNSLSVGNYLRESTFSSWKVDRGELFDQIKDRIGRGIFGFSKSDKWNPMDIMLIKPGSEEEINQRIAEAEVEDNSDLQLGKINGMFVDMIDSNNDKNLILGISLKEAKAQAGKAKGYLKKIAPNFDEKYNLTKEEKDWFGDDQKLLQEIIIKRDIIQQMVTKRVDEFTYTLENGGIEDYNMQKSPLNKYAALKMLSFILEEADKDKNIFTGIVQYGLSLEKNPTFFKLKGNIEGDAEKVGNDIEKFPSAGGVQLYDPQDDDFDGKIKITDSNESMGLYVEYYIEFGGVVYYAKISIRSNSSGQAVQVTIEINKWKEYDNLNEMFYPILFGN